MSTQIENLPRRGMMMGLLASALLGVLLFIVLTVGVLKGTWSSIIHTAGGDIRSIIGWIFIYEIIPVVGSVMIAFMSAPFFACLGWCVGWVLQKRSR